MSQVMEWWSKCSDRLAQSLVRLFGRQVGEFFMGATKWQKDQVVDKVCKCMHHSPWRAPVLRYKYTTCAVLSFLTQGDFTKSEQ